jgi:hypothetical protein
MAQRETDRLEESAWELGLELLSKKQIPRSATPSGVQKAHSARDGRESAQHLRATTTIGFDKISGQNREGHPGGPIR